MYFLYHDDTKSIDVYTEFIFYIYFFIFAIIEKINTK